MKLLSAAAVCFLALYFIDATFADGLYYRAFLTMATYLVRAVSSALA